MKIILLGKPISTQHAYLMRGRIKFMRKEAKELKESYIKQATEQYWCELLTWDLTVTIELYFPDKRKRDWDNWHKLTMDALTWVVWEDDSQIKSAHIYIRDIDRETPRIELTIT